MIFKDFFSLLTLRKEKKNDHNYYAQNMPLFIFRIQ